MNSRNLNKLSRRRRTVYPSKDSFTFYHPGRRRIKPQRKKNRAFPAVLIIILFILIGCFYVPGGSDHYPKDQNTVSNKDIARFFSKVKPSHSHIESQYRYAIHLQKIGKHKISVEVLNDITRYDPSSPKIYNALGISYDALADFEKANQAYQKALNLDPNLDYVHNNLGYSKLLQKDYEGAKKSFRMAISLAAKNSDVSKYENNLALANAKAGTPDETLADNEETVDSEDVEQPSAVSSTIEDEAQWPEDSVVQAPKVNMAAVDTTDLHWEDDRALADLPNLEKDNVPRLPANSDPDNSAIEVAKIATEKEVDPVQVAAVPQEKTPVAKQDVEPPQPGIGTIETTVRAPDNAIAQAPKVNMAAVDTTDLHWEDDRASTDLPNLEKDNVPRLPANSDPDNSAIEVAKIATEKEVDPVQVAAVPQEKTPVANQDIEPPRPDIGTIEDTAEMPEDRIEQAPEIILAAADTPELDPEDGRASAKLSDLEEDSTPHSPEIPNPDHPNLEVAKIQVEPDKKIDPIQLAADPQEKKPVVKQDIEPPQPDIGAIEDTAQVPEDRIEQVPEVRLIIADSTNLDPKDEHAPLDFSNVEKDRAPRLPDNSNTVNSNRDHSKLDVAKTEPEKEMYWVQVGALRKLQNAERVQRKLSDEVDNLYISEAHIKGRRYYRVRVGPFKNILDAEKTQSRLKSVKGIQGFTSKTPMKPQRDVYSVQVGALQKLERAEKLKRILSDEVDNLYISEADIQGIRYYRVRVGPFKNILDAENAKRRLKNVKSLNGFIAYQNPGAYGYDRPNIDEAITAGDHVDYKVGIEVSNGNGIDRMARRVGNFLSQKGFKIMRLTNAITFNIKKTIIYFTKGYREKAVYVENQFPGDQAIEEVQSNDRPGIQLKIVIGDDLRAHDRKLFVDDYETDGFASKGTQYPESVTGINGI